MGWWLHGKPRLEPLIQRCRSSDTVIVQRNPTRRSGVPRLAHEIADRLNEITFNSSLVREIRAVAAITKMIERGVITDHRYQLAYFHLIEAGDALAGLGVRSKLDSSWTLLSRLKELGRAAADRWLAENFEHLGERSTMDLSAWKPTEYYEGEGAPKCKV